MDLDKLIRSWELYGWTPRGEFQDLSSKLIGHLYRGSDEEKLSRVLYSELVTNYGLDMTEFDANELMKELMNWWNEQSHLPHQAYPSA